MRSRKSNIPPRGNIPQNVRGGLNISVAGVDLSLGRSDGHLERKKFGRVQKTFQRPAQKKPAYFRSPAKNNLPPLQNPVKKYPREVMVDIFNEEGKYQIIIELSYHKADLKWGIVDRLLELKSSLNDYCEKFTLPEDVLIDSISVFFKNGLFDITFKKN
ncbi:Hsp20/alpha crystallin family protein [Candidatus Parcubacteria bacterium]|nr:Hsp20/alpha crystallin family protein [Candidatus Parcubacteria bacterium]